MKRREMIKTIGAAALATVFTAPSLAFDGPELYKGEKDLYEAAKKEGMVVSFDTGPTWANWGSKNKAAGPVRASKAAICGCCCTPSGSRARHKVTSRWPQSTTEASDASSSR